MLLSEAFNIYEINVLRYEGRKPKTIHNYHCAIQSYLDACGDTPIELVTMDSIVVWKEYMRQKPNKSSTIYKNIVCLRSVLRYMETRGLKVIDTRDISLPSVEKPDPNWLEVEEVKAMIEAAKNTRDKAIIAMLFSTGCRISELLSLNVEDVVNNNEPMVCGKGDKYREVYIDSTARKYLDAYLAERNDRFKPLFMSGQYGRIHYTTVDKMLRKCALEAGIDKNVSAHVFRHSTITDYIKNHAPMAMVQKIAGHSRITTTIDIYSHLQNPEVAQVARQFHTSNY